MTPTQRRALAVLVAAETGRPERRPVIASDRGTARDIDRRELLTVHTPVAYGLVDAGLVRVTNHVLQTLELTDTGRALARKAGL